MVDTANFPASAHAFFPLSAEAAFLELLSSLRISAPGFMSP
jgi:hypothetical protein